jgi:gliding motility-associated-like protein/uncharacterized repeat protein (TIGR01451 family)
VSTVPVNTVVSKQTSIGLLKTAPVQVNAGNSIQYVITATNNGPSDATGIVIADVIPAAVTNVKWTITTTGSAGIAGSSTGTGNTIAVTGNIPAGSQHSIQLVVTGTVNATFSGTLANTATVTLPGSTPVNSNTTNTLVSRTANISIQKTAPAALFESNTIVYRIQVNNAGPSAADGTTVTDVLPGSITGATVQVVSSTGGTANVTAAISNNTLNATIGSLPSGGQLVLEITGTIAAGTSGIITNTATVNIPAGVTDPDITNNSASAVTNSTARGKLTVEKLITTATPYSVGKTISYVLKVTNTGTVAINPVAITDILPPLTKVSVPVVTTVPAGTTATYNAGNNTINWNIGFMAAGAVLQLGYNVTALDSGTISNKAVTAGPRSVAIPDSVTSTITNEYLSDLGIQKTLTMQGSTLSVHDDIQFTLTVTNKGPNRATGVQVSDPLAPNLDAPRNIVASAGNAAYEAAIRNLVWNVGNMEVNATATLTFTVRVNSGGTVVNTATISGNEKDPGTGNNTGTSTPAPVNGSDIFIPNTITPNGDGKNDKFIIPGLNRYPNSVLTIYNRWGNQVYHSSNYDNSWDGSGLSGGTYYYMLELRTPQQGMQVQKGWVVLLR